MGRRVRAVIGLIRPVNIVITMISVYIGGWMGGGILDWRLFGSGMIIAGLTCAGANAHNDYLDSAIDRINKPNRPIPSGAIDPIWGKFLSVMFAAVSVIWSFLLGFSVFLLVLFTTGMLWYYNRWGKRQTFIGNIFVSGASAMAFIFGGVLCGVVHEAVIPAVFALLFHFGREIVKDLEDVEGDREDGVSSIPIRYGKQTALIWISVTFFALIGFSFYPYIFHGYRLHYMVTVLLGVDLFLVYVLNSLWANPDKKNAGQMRELLKADMIVGLIALVLR